MLPFLNDIESTVIIRYYEKEEEDKFYENRARHEIGMKYDWRTPSIDRMVKIFRKKDNMSKDLELKGYWRYTVNKYYLSRLAFFRKGNCTCCEKCKCCGKVTKLCTHGKVKRELDKLFIYLIGDPGPSLTVFKFLY